MENCGSAVMSVISFLRGQLINHDTPPTPQVTRSKPIRPLSLTFIIACETVSTTQGDKVTKCAKSDVRGHGFRASSPCHLVTLSPCHRRMDQTMTAAILALTLTLAAAPDSPTRELLSP